MKWSKVLSILSLLLVLFIVTPTMVKRIKDQDNSQLNVEVTKEKNNPEEKEEHNEKNNLFFITGKLNTNVSQKRKAISKRHILRYYAFTKTILLPPPKLDL